MHSATQRGFVQHHECQATGIRHTPARLSNCYFALFLRLLFHRHTTSTPTKLLLAHFFTALTLYSSHTQNATLIFNFNFHSAPCHHINTTLPGSRPHSKLHCHTTITHTPHKPLCAFYPSQPCKTAPSNLNSRYLTPPATLQSTTVA
jgi:hypothetical protein